MSIKIHYKNKKNENTSLLPVVWYLNALIENLGNC